MTQLAASPAVGERALVDVELKMPEETVEEVQHLAGEFKVSPGQVLGLGAAALALYLSILAKRGRLIAEYPDGTRTEVKLAP